MSWLPSSRSSRWSSGRLWSSRAGPASSAAEPGASPGDAVQQAVREAAPSVVGVTLVIAAILVAPAVMGTTAGLEAFHPFAVSMLAGLVTATLVFARCSSRFYLVIANRAVSKEKGHPGDDHSCNRNWNRGEFMKLRGLAAVGHGSCGDHGRWQRLQRGRGVERREPDTAVTVEENGEDQPARLTVSERAEQRLGLRTEPVRPLTGQANGATEVIAYSAVVYDADGKSWTFSAPSPRTYIRVPIVISSIAGQTVSAQERAAGRDPGRGRRCA